MPKPGDLALGIVTTMLFDLFYRFIQIGIPVEVCDKFTVSDGLHRQGISVWQKGSDLFHQACPDHLIHTHADACIQYVSRKIAKDTNDPKRERSAGISPQFGHRPARHLDEG